MFAACLPNWYFLVFLLTIPKRQCLQGSILLFFSWSILVELNSLIHTESFNYQLHNFTKLCCLLTCLPDFTAEHFLFTESPMKPIISSLKPTPTCLALTYNHHHIVKCGNLSLAPLYLINITKFSVFFHSYSHCSNQTMILDSPNCP